MNYKVKLEVEERVESDNLRAKITWFPEARYSVAATDISDAYEKIRYEIAEYVAQHRAHGSEIRVTISAVDPHSTGVE